MIDLFVCVLNFIMSIRHRAQSTFPSLEVKMLPPHSWLFNLSLGSILRVFSYHLQNYIIILESLILYSRS